MLYSGQRNTLLAEIVECGFEIVNRLWHSGIFEHAFDSTSECLVFQRDHRPSPGRIRNSDALYNSGTLIRTLMLTLTLRIRGLQGQKPRLCRLRLLVFRRALDVNAVTVLCRNCQSERRVPDQALQILLKFRLRLDLPVVALFHFKYGKQLFQQRSKFELGKQRS